MPIAVIAAAYDRPEKPGTARLGLAIRHQLVTSVGLGKWERRGMAAANQGKNMKTAFKRFAGVAAMAALAMPSMAMAAPGNPAASLSVAGNVRAAAPVKKASKLGSTVINLAIFAVLVGGGLLLITTGDDKSKSP